MVLLACSSYSYRLQCPDFSQRPLRALGYCTSSLRSKYTCLYDTNKLLFTEQCNRNPDFVTPGKNTDLCLFIWRFFASRFQEMYIIKLGHRVSFRGGLAFIITSFSYMFCISYN